MSDAVVVLDDLQPDELEVLRVGLDGRYRVEQGTGNGGFANDAAFLITRRHDVNTGQLSATSRLRAVIQLAGGECSVDQTTCEQRGIAVHVIRSLSLITVAEHTVLLMLALLKRFVTAMDDLRSGRVVGDVQPALTTQTSYAYNWIGLTGFEPLYRKRIGLVGLGAIGREVAVRLRAFGCTVVYTKRTPLAAAEEDALGVRYAPLEELLEGSDCVSLHHRFDPAEEPYMGRREFDSMRPGSYFINTARGRLVDEDALIDALKRGHLAGAALDVFRYEPLPSDSPLLSAPNLILTPHVGGIPSHLASLAEMGEVVSIIRSYQ